MSRNHALLAMLAALGGAGVLQRVEPKSPRVIDEVQREKVRAKHRARTLRRLAKWNGATEVGVGSLGKDPK